MQLCNNVAFSSCLLASSVSVLEHEFLKFLNWRMFLSLPSSWEGGLPFFPRSVPARVVPLMATRPFDLDVDGVLSVPLMQHGFIQCCACRAKRTVWMFVGRKFPTQKNPDASVQADSSAVTSSLPGCGFFLGTYPSPFDWAANHTSAWGHLFACRVLR